MPVLDQITAAIRESLPALHADRDQVMAAAASRPPAPDFAAALQGGSVALIAEVKRHSPSLGAINPTLDPVRLAGAYARGGAAAISVLTEGPHFGGDPADLVAVAEQVGRPTLRKDFIVDPLQVYQARALGAAAVLLIVRILDQALLRDLLALTHSLGMAALVETHSAAEIERALAADARIIGVNARDLDTLTIDTVAAWRLVAGVPADRIAVAESGMATADDVRRAADAGADAVLIGSALARAADPAALAAALSAVPRRGR